MRAVLIVLDSVGIGAAPDAADYGDAGANTLGHLYELDHTLCLKNLEELGLRRLLRRSLNQSATGVQHRSTCGCGCGDRVMARHGIMQPRSAGKDSTTGHWELAGVTLDQPFATFESFPEELIQSIQRAAGVQFIGNCRASGTAIIDEFGAEHLRSGRLILYTSADSVLQIAAHEDVVPPERLNEVCRIARSHADHYRIGRVIARPFVGQPGEFSRTANRHDFSMAPPRTVLDELRQATIDVIGIGKTGDLFAHRGLSRSIPTSSNAQGMQCIEQIWSTSTDGLLFANLVDFDTLYGHRRDAAGYIKALREFDQWLGSFLLRVAEDDLLIITADHGNDPTHTGTDHTRELVPLLVMHQQQSDDLGLLRGFDHVAQMLRRFFEIGEHAVDACAADDRATAPISTVGSRT